MRLVQGHAPNIRRPAQNVARKRVWGDFSTGGSRGIRDSHEYVRKGGAAARDDAGAGRGQRAGTCRPSECTAANSVITHAPLGPHDDLRQGRRGRRASSTPPKDVTLKDPKDWKIIGKPVKRLDTADKLDRQAGLRHRPEAARAC